MAGSSEAIKSLERQLRARSTMPNSPSRLRSFSGVRKRLFLGGGIKNNCAITSCFFPLFFIILLQEHQIFMGENYNAQASTRGDK